MTTYPSIKHPVGNFNPDCRRFPQRCLATALAGVLFAGLAAPLGVGAAAFPAVLPLWDIDGNSGFRVDGAITNDRLGWSVAGAGDINGDGFDDLMIGAPYAVNNGNNPGIVYVVFGHAGGFTHPLAVSTLNGGNGFRILGISHGDQFGQAVSGAGDINGDGFADLAIGAPGSDLSANNAGAGFVLFGKTSAFPATQLLLLNGTNGFAVSGENANDYAGHAISGSGRHNGGALDDLIIGAFHADPAGTTRAGKSYVVFGKSGGFSALLALSGMAGGTQGYGIPGTAPDDYAGTSVGSAGDVNGDGFDDLIIGAPHQDPLFAYAGKSYVVFGKAGPFTSTLALTTLNGNNGFRLDGPAGHDYAGFAVNSAGDINGDGFSDLIVGAFGATPTGFNAGSSYVVFGHSGNFTHPLDLSGLNGQNGFRLDGESAGNKSGFSVSRAGDINGDGLGDLLIGAKDANASSGRTYVVFGRSGGGFPHPLALSSLDGNNGFRLDGVEASDSSGHSVRAAGDINGDGVDDLVIGAPNAAPSDHPAAGSSYVVFGRKPELVFADGFEQP